MPPRSTDVAMISAVTPQDERVYALLGVYSSTYTPRTAFVLSYLLL